MVEVKFVILFLFFAFPSTVIASFSYDLTADPIEFEILHQGADADYYISSSEADIRTAKAQCKALSNSLLLSLETREEFVEISKGLKRKGVDSIWTSGQKRGSSPSIWVPAISSSTYSNGSLSRGRRAPICTGKHCRNQGNLNSNCEERPKCDVAECEVTLPPCQTIDPICNVESSHFQESKCSVIRPNCSATCPPCQTYKPPCEIRQFPCSVNNSGDCQVIPGNCSVTQPVCSTERKNCTTFVPPCEITVPPPCTTKLPCRLTTERPCVTTKPPCRVTRKPCVKVTPPCYEEPQPCTYQVDKSRQKEKCETHVAPGCEGPDCPEFVICEEVDEDDDYEDIDAPAGKMVCPPPVKICPPETEVCPEPITFCPEEVTTCKPVDLCPPPEVCQSPAIICPQPITKCPPPVTVCKPAEVICEDPHVICKPPEVHCPKPEYVCPPVQIICPSPEVTCPAAVVHCPPPDLSCTKLNVTCPAPVINCPPTSPCVLPIRSTLPPCTTTATEATAVEVDEVIPPKVKTLCISIKKTNSYRFDYEDCQNEHRFICEKHFNPRAV